MNGNYDQHMGWGMHIDASNEIEYKTLVAYIKSNLQQTIDIDMT